ncbi:hypothetical protein SAMN04487967_1310 [Natronorubrum sediminis]|uniref:Uncharacterized protein n=1 Tax=Natronorubrum sediminis TaxID=640943 RepID=A0A1H6FTS8_9EURY|nr:hypothetical protein SAMN04487967_1310 [Natronorubrum sediminis]
MIMTASGKDLCFRRNMSNIVLEMRWLCVESTGDGLVSVSLGAVTLVLQ